MHHPMQITKGAYADSPLAPYMVPFAVSDFISWLIIHA